MEPAAGDIDESGVIGIEGLRYQHLVPLVQNTGHGDLQRLAAAEGGQNILPLQGTAHARVVGPQGLHIPLLAGSRRIGHHRRVKISHRIEKRLGRLHVRLPDVQVMNPDTPRSGRHLPGIELPHGREPAPLNLTG